METISKIKDLKRSLLIERQKGNSIGFVPTMGALHPGHLSLIERSVQENSFTVVSIFVNPTQFNNKQDLHNYPRNTKKDITMLEKSGCNIAFIPNESEMYPEPDTREFDFGEMANIMEGRFRPGHYRGVAQIVTKLFNSVEPDKAYFGQKDFQQLAIIKKLVIDLKYPIQIISCPTMREPDGLAMSSRNALLSKKHREAAPLIYRTLLEVKKNLTKLSVEQQNKFVTERINSNPLLNIEYFNIVDSISLAKINKIEAKKSLTACIAVYAERVRLIDNIELIS